MNEVLNLQESMEAWIGISEDSDYLRPFGIPSSYPEIRIQTLDYIEKTADVVAGPRDGKIELRFRVRVHISLSMTRDIAEHLGLKETMNLEDGLVGVEGEALITWVVVKDYEDQAGITGMGQQIAYESTLIPST